MAELEISVGKSKYNINCTDSEIPRITALASRLNEKVNEMSLKMRGADEKTILMLAAMMTQAELESVKAGEKKSDFSIQNSNQEENLIDHIEIINSSIENLANKIKNY